MPAPKGNQNAKGNRGGNGGPIIYDPNIHPRKAYRFALLGLTDEQIADALDVSASTIDKWKKEHIEFVTLLKKGKDEADSKVAQSLYKRATGYSHKAVKIFADPKTGETLTVPYIERYPPETAAMIFWLKNRKSNLWRDKIEMKHSGDPTEPITVQNISNLSDDELANRAKELAEKVKDTKS